MTLRYSANVIEETSSVIRIPNDSSDILMFERRLTGLQPVRMSLRNKALEAEMVSKYVVIAPNDVSAVWWGEPSMLHLKAANKVHILVPVDSVYNDTSIFLLALIRWLRSGDRPISVLIPENLRCISGELAEDNTKAADAAEVRLTASERWAFLVLALIFTVPLAGLIVEKMPIHRAVPIAAFLVITVVALIWWATSAVMMRADGNGLTSVLLWRKSRVKWQDIADVSFGSLAGSGLQNMTQRYTLWSADGKMLSTIFLGWGSKNDWALFTKALYARLAEVLPPDKLTQPWKSCPWKAD